MVVRCNAVNCREGPEKVTRAFNKLKKNVNSESSANEWIRKLWYIYTMEYYLAIKKKTLESVLMRWMKLESIIQS